MPKLEFTDQDLKDYFSGAIKHHFHKETIELADDMRVHADGIFPETLIKSRRPNEPQEVLDYRKDIFIAKTKPFFTKILSSLSKIRRSADWSIRYPTIDEFTKIDEEEKLQEYCEVNFPDFDSVTNWVFAALLKKYLVDPNALVFVFPLEVKVPENEYLQPFPVIFDSVDVIDYVADDYAVLVNPLGSTFYVRNKAQRGKSYFLVTTTSIIRWDQINSKGELAITLDYQHGLPELPIFRIGAMIKDSEGNNYLHESRIASIIPEFNEALREYSDLQAAKVIHIYPERWEYSNAECSTCKGTGKRNRDFGYGRCEIVECDACQGSGYRVPGPYSKIMVRPPNNIEGTGQVPLPPAGYVEKDVEIVKIQDDGVDKHIYNALSSINFEFLANAPLSQSGTAKEVDKDELNNTVHAIAEDLVRVMDKIYRLIAFYRYKMQYSFDDIVEMLPVIAVPEKFDILSSKHLEEELTNAKTNKVNPVIQNAMELEYANKKFNNDPSVRDRLKLILELDPLPNVSEEDKFTRLSNKGITLETYVLSSNIHEFVQRAIEEDEGFPEMDLVDQKETVREYAREQIKNEDEASKISKSVVDETGGLDMATGELSNVDLNGNSSTVIPNAAV